VTHSQLDQKLNLATAAWEEVPPWTSKAPSSHWVTFLNGFQLDLFLPQERTGGRWQVGLGYSKPEEFLEKLCLAVPELEVNRTSWSKPRAVVRFPTLQEALDFIPTAVERVLAAGMEAPGREAGAGRTPDPGYFAKLARRFLHAASDPDGLGNDPGAVAGRLDIDGHDDIAYCGRSRAAAAAGLVLGSPGSWREHAVPVNAVRDEAWRRAAAGAPVAELAQFFKQHLVVVLLTEEEARGLDASYTPSGRCLRDFMPDGWQWGQDVFARLRTAPGFQLE